MKQTTHNFNQKLAIGHQYEAEMDERFSDHFDIEPVTLDEEKALGIDRRFTNRQTGRMFTIQYKADEVASRTGNAFVETVSMDTYRKRGWAYTCRADYILYYVPGMGVCYVLKPDVVRAQLKRWQARYRKATAQNDGYKTHGVLVPLDEFEEHAEAVVST